MWEAHACPALTDTMGLLHRADAVGGGSLGECCALGGPRCTGARGWTVLEQTDPYLYLHCYSVMRS